MGYTYSAGQRQLQSAWRDFVADQTWNFWITLNFNREATFEGAKAKLIALDARLNRAILGSDWAKKPQDQRLRFVAFPEHPDSNFHYHVFMFSPKTDGLDALVTKHWEKLVPGGQAHVCTPEQAEDWEVLSGYSTKALGQSRLMDNVVVSGDQRANTV